MARIEKTVFISYRRTDVYTALAVYENLKNQGYDVFFDYRSISSGDFEQIIIANIKARAHFLIILTPTALDRLNEPGDWLRREIETAVDEKRNIVPLFFRGFRFGTPFVKEKLSGKLKNLSRYNGLKVHEDYFEEAMHRVRKQFLSKPLDTVLHPASTQVRKVVKEEQNAADEALRHIEVKKKPVKQTKEIPSKPRIKFTSKLFAKLRSNLSSQPTIKFLSLISVGFLIIVVLFVAGMLVVNNWSRIFTLPTLDVGSTMIGKDGMILVYVPAGEFIMGNDNGELDEVPVGTVTLDAYWIDQTEVTNRMYALCVTARACEPPADSRSYDRPDYYGNPEFDNYPVIFIDWHAAKTYCEWAERRLPTEAEWEKAARGKDGRAYPWGNKLPNSKLLNYDSNIGDTTAVGIYPDGASPYGALDMSGNAWEWVNSIYVSYPYNSADGREDAEMDGKRGFRGGSWESDEYLVRSSFRGWDEPSYFSINLGFRCASDRSP